MGEPRSGEAWRIVSLGHIDHWPTVVQRLIPQCATLVLGSDVALPAFAQLKDVGAVILDCSARIALDSAVGNTYRKEWLNVDVAATRWRNTRIVVTEPHWSASHDHYWQGVRSGREQQQRERSKHHLSTNARGILRRWGARLRGDPRPCRPAEPGASATRCREVDVDPGRGAGARTNALCAVTVRRFVQESGATAGRVDVALLVDQRRGCVRMHATHRTARASECGALQRRRLYAPAVSCTRY